MRNKKKLYIVSNISGYGALSLAIIYTFFDNYVGNSKVLFVLGVVLILVFVGTEIIKYLAKKSK